MSAPKCPFNGGDQRMQVDPDQPCPVCGDYGDHRAWDSNNCVDGDEPVTSHAAAAAEIARLRAEVAALREALQRIAETRWDADATGAVLCMIQTDARAALAQEQAP